MSLSTRAIDILLWIGVVLGATALFIDWLNGK